MAASAALTPSLHSSPHSPYILTRNSNGEPDSQSPMDSVEESIVVGMPPKSFLHEFMPCGTSVAPSVSFADVPGDGDNKRTVEQICTRLISKLEASNVCPAIQLSIPRLALRSSATSVKDNDDPKKVAQIQKSLLPAIAARNASSSAEGGEASRYSFGTLELMIEVYADDSQDPFSNTTPAIRASDTNGKGSANTADKATPGRPGTQAGRAELLAPTEALEQPKVLNCSPKGAKASKAMLARIEAQFVRQHRVFLFQVIICNRHAHFVFWDRAGAIVSCAFDYVAQPHLLAEFFWRFSRLSPVQRGWDDSVCLASKEEVWLYKKNAAAFLLPMLKSKDDPAVRKLPHPELCLDATFPTWKIRVSNDDTGAATDLLVNRPMYVEPGIIGRSTRGYVAYDMQAGQFVFLKDTTPRHYAGAPPSEMRTALLLQRHNVPHVPRAHYGGDVRYADGSPQDTFPRARLRDLVATLTPAQGRRVFRHHRIVQDIVYPLNAVRDERELVQVMHDVVHAIVHAYWDAGLVHRDISAANIMVTADGRGVLNDWDQAVDKSVRRPAMGTWLWLSIRLKENPDRSNEHIDDLESVFWVFFVHALLHFCPDPGPFSPDAIFKEHELDERGRTVGGAVQLRMLQDTESVENLRFSSEPLAEGIRMLHLAWFWCHLHLSPPEEPAENAEEFADVLRVAAGLYEQQCNDRTYWTKLVSSALALFPTSGPSQPVEADATSPASPVADATESPPAAPANIPVDFPTVPVVPQDSEPMLKEPVEPHAGRSSAVPAADGPRRSARLKSSKPTIAAAAAPPKASTPRPSTLTEGRPLGRTTVTYTGKRRRSTRNDAEDGKPPARRAKRARKATEKQARNADPAPPASKAGTKRRAKALAHDGGGSETAVDRAAPELRRSKRVGLPVRR